MKKVFSILFLFLGFFVHAQDLNVSRYDLLRYELEREAYRKGMHTIIQPFTERELGTFLNSNSVEEIHSPSDNKYLKYVWDGVFNRDFVSVDNEKYRVSINPLLHFGGGRELGENKTTWYNTRGFEVKVDVKDRISFYTSFHENQGVFPNYMDSYIRKHGVVPGQGFARTFGDGFDYAYSTGYVSIPATKYFNIQFGHGSSFWGDGERSLLLSDYAFPYPYLKVTMNIWRVKYVSLFAQLQDLKQPASPNLGWQKKYSSLHLLSLSLHRRLKLSVFEAVNWMHQDSIGVRGFEINYLNPVIFFRPVEFSVGSPDNVLMGLNLSYVPIDDVVVYGQLILDEFKLSEVRARNGWWANKQGLQVGLKYYDAFGLDNMFLRAEYNVVRPYTYSHWTSLQNYGHYNEPMAHPLGANFKEFVGIASYRYNRWLADLRYQYAIVGKDKDGLNYGFDIFRSYQDRVSDYGNYIGQGLKTTINSLELKLVYILNVSYGFQVYAQYGYRSEVDENDELITNWVSLGLKTSVFRNR